MWSPVAAPVTCDASKLVARNQDRMREAPNMLRSINPRLIQVWCNMPVSSPQVSPPNLPLIICLAIPFLLLKHADCHHALTSFAYKQLADIRDLLLLRA